MIAVFLPYIIFPLYFNWLLFSFFNKIFSLFGNNYFNSNFLGDIYDDLLFISTTRRFYGEKSIISVFKSIIIFILNVVHCVPISAFRIVYES
jgi:hypothetical protein